MRRNAEFVLDKYAWRGVVTLVETGRLAMSEGELVLYSTEDGVATIGLRAVDGTVWLSQREIAELFDKDVRTVNEHIRNIFTEGECDPEATIRKFRIVQTEGARQVEREVDALESRSAEGIPATGSAASRA